MTTWVLVRGLAREAGHWGAFPAMLRQRAGEAVVAIDLPGNGTLFEQRSPAHVAQMAQAAREEALRRGARPPYMLVAISLGGMVATQWALDSPGDIAGCALVNSSFAGLSPLTHRLRPASWPVLAALLLPGWSDVARERRVLDLTSNAGSAATYAGLWATYARRHPVSRANLVRQLIAAARYTMPSQAPRVPVTVLASANDRLVSAACSVALATRWGLPFELHPWAGHDLPLDDAPWLVERLIAFRAACHAIDTKPTHAFHW